MKWLLALFVAVTAHTVREQTQIIRELHSVYVWPKGNPDLFWWEFKYGEPWIAMILGVISGNVINIRKWDELILGRERAVQNIVLTARGERSSQNRFIWLWVPAVAVSLCVPAALLTYYFHLSAAVYLFTSSASTAALSYFRYRRQYLDAQKSLDTTVLTEREFTNVATWRTKERRAAHRFLAGSLVLILLLFLGGVAWQHNVVRIYDDIGHEIAARPSR